MKRLFQVNTSPVAFFDNKMDAKAVRGESLSLRVSKGPDHMLFGVKGIGKTHSHNAKTGGPGNSFPADKKRR